MTTEKLKPVPRDTIYRLASCKTPGRYWFVGKDEHDIYVWDRENSTGMCGEEVAFRIGEGEKAVVVVKGPFCASARSLFEETGVRI